MPPLPKNFPEAAAATDALCLFHRRRLCRLLESTSVLQVGHSPHVPTIYRTLLLLLSRKRHAHWRGAWPGHAGRSIFCCPSDHCSRHQVFSKTRLVPIGPRLNRRIGCTYGTSLPAPVARRRRHPRYSPTRDGRPWSAMLASYPGFSMFVAPPELVARVGEPRPPRLHDIRHTAAVHRVPRMVTAPTRNVQRLLPQLATYLGHLDIRSTQRYLQMTPDLLLAASQRFAQEYAMGGRS